MNISQKSATYRKLRKLLKNPRAFWDDGKYNPKNMLESMIFEKYDEVLKKNRVSLAADNREAQLNNNLIAFSANNKDYVSNLNVIEDFSFEYIIKLLQDYGLIGIYITPLEQNLKSAIAILDSHKLKGLTSIVRMVTEQNFGIQYKIKGKTIKPLSLNQLWNDLSNINCVDIRLSTDRILDEKLGIQWLRLEFWKELEDFYFAPVSNHISRKLWKTAAETYNFFRIGLQDYHKILAYEHSDVISFDIDLVFTWVNADDPEWIEMYKSFSSAKLDTDELTDAESNSRFLSRDELKYSLRSWEKHGDFIRNIYIVSNCAPPPWINMNHPKIHWVYHEQIMSESNLPTFNSHAIETSLHKIPGLSKYFIYCNDDILLLKTHQKSDYYFSNGIAKVRLEKYGNVNGCIMEGQPDYLNAARNGIKLLEETFKKTPTQLHTHSPQSMRTDVLATMNDLYIDAFSKTQSHRFRTLNDISVTSFLYQHYSILDGKALDIEQPSVLIKESSNYQRIMKRLLNQYKSNDCNKLPYSVCINDGADSHLNAEWNTAVIEFCEALFPEKSRYEI